VDTATERQMQRLEDRIDRLEQTVLSCLAWLSAALLVLGLLLDYLTVDESGDEDDEASAAGSLLTIGFKALSYEPSDGEKQGFDVFLGVCYLGLVVVTLVALWLLVVIGGRTATERLARVVNLVAGLLVFGVLGAAPIALIALGEESEGDMGPGLLVFAGGVLVFVVLAATRLREWWDPSRMMRRPTPR
jgi:hypothetical protein